MNCILWYDGAESGCVDFDQNGDNVVGRSMFSREYRWMPRKVFQLLPAGNFWQIHLITSNDWIALHFYDGRKWQRVGERPATIDGNTMIRISFIDSNFDFRLVFQSGTDCQHVTYIEALWTSPIWEQQSESEEPIVIAHAIPVTETRERRVAQILEWLALYFEQHTWAAVLSVLTLAGMIYLVHQYPINLFPTAPTNQSK